MSGADTAESTEEKKDADDVAAALDTLKVNNSEDKETTKEETTDTAPATEAEAATEAEK